VKEPLVLQYSVCTVVVHSVRCNTVCVVSVQGGSKKTKHNNEEFDMADVSDIQPRARSGRAAAKPVKYNFDTDDDDDDDDVE